MQNFLDVLPLFTRHTGVPGAFAGLTPTKNSTLPALQVSISKPLPLTVAALIGTVRL